MGNKSTFRLSYIHKYQLIPRMPADTDEVLQKLKQIEELAQFALHQSPEGLGKDHIKLIISLAKYLETEIEQITPAQPR